MLSLKIGNTYVDTVDADIPVVLRSPVFPDDDGHIAGSFIFNFTLPLTAQLKRELSFAHRASRKGKPVFRHPFTLRFGRLQYQGTANITELSGKEVKVNMPVETGSLAPLLADKSLKDLPINEAVDFNPQISFADCSYPYSYEHSQQHLFVHDVWIRPSMLRIDTFDAYSGEDGSWTCPASGQYTMSVVINWSFGKVDYLGQSNDLGTTPVFRIYRNGVVLHAESIPGNSFAFRRSFDLEAGDVIRFSLRAVSVPVYPLHHLQVRIETGTVVSVFREGVLFESATQDAYPESSYAVFPYSNPMILENLPESLFSVDFNDIKDQTAKYSPVVNYYVDDNFPLVISGFRDGKHFNLLNLFSPAPYVAFIVRKILELIGYTAVNNVFESDSLKRLCLLSNCFINNYCHDGRAHELKDFLPDIPVKDFLVSLCRSLGVAFAVHTASRQIRFMFVSDILQDHSAIDFNRDIIGDPMLHAVDYDSFSLKLAKPDCDFISQYSRPLKGLNILEPVNSWNQLPLIPQINDCCYVANRRSWYVWNYDTEMGLYNWIFHSVDYPFEIGSEPEVKGRHTLELEIPYSSTAQDYWHPILGAGDKTIGAPANRIWVIPAFHVAGNFRQLPETFQAQDAFCLQLYHGLQQDSQQRDYPLGSCDVYDLQGNKMVNADHSLRLDTEPGLYERGFRRLIDWQLDAPGEYTLYKQLTPLEIASIDWFRFYSIRGVNYLLKEIRFNIRQDHLSVAEITALRR